LACYNGCLFCVPVFNDFQEVQLLLAVHWGETPIIPNSE
jgi:hypothetical protein